MLYLTNANDPKRLLDWAYETTNDAQNDPIYWLDKSLPHLPLDRRNCLRKRNESTSHADAPMKTHHPDFPIDPIRSVLHHWKHFCLNFDSSPFHRTHKLNCARSFVYSNCCNVNSQNYRKTQHLISTAYP